MRLIFSTFYQSFSSPKQRIKQSNTMRTFADCAGSHAQMRRGGIHAAILQHGSKNINKFELLHYKALLKTVCLI